MGRLESGTDLGRKAIVLLGVVQQVVRQSTE